MAVPSFLFGGDTKETPDSIKRKRDLVRAIMGASNAPKNIGEGLNALGDGIVANVLDRRANRAEEAGQSAASNLFNSILGSPATPGATGSAMPAVSPSGNIAAVPSQPGEVYSPFIDTVKSSINNPYGLAAVAATGQAESAFSPQNANRTWSDPSESGKAATAGGIMSWRGPRLAALQQFAQANGEQPGNISPQTQAKFFLQEDPSLVASLNNAKSVEEAQQLMNRAWAFRGYDRPGGEAARRISLASGFLPKFQGQGGGGQEVASLDPSAGMGPQSAPEAINAAAPPSGYVDPQVTTDFRQPMVASAPQARAPMQGPTQPAPVLPPPTTISNAPAVAAMPSPAPQPQPPQQQVAQNASPFGGVDPRLLQALQNPWLNDGQKQAVQILIQQQMQAGQQQQEEQTWRAREDYKLNSQRADPAYKLEQDYKQAQLEALKNKTGKSNLINAGEGNIYDPDTQTWIKAPSATGKTGDAFRFGGNSVEAQALNGLIESGQITAEQAQQLGAGKTITDPSTGAMMFLTPQGIFKQQQGQQPVQQTQAPQQPYVDLFGDGGANIPSSPAPANAPTAAPAAPASPPVADAVSGNNPGIIPLTGGKPQKLLTENERKNQSLSTVMEPELRVVEDSYDALSDTKNQLYSKIPFSEFVTTPEYQKAANSLQTIVSSYLYSVSGATATPEEVRKQTDILTPRPGESPESIANKRQRVRTMVNAVRQAGSLPPLAEPAPVSEDIKAARDAIARGAPRDAVIKRLQDAGIDTTGL
ncbi:MAG: phage tail tip lysozyme [Pseudomonas sp.]